MFTRHHPADWPPAINARVVAIAFALAAVTVLIAWPWLGPLVAEADAPPSKPSTWTPRPGPWGELTCTRIVIAPPPHALDPTPMLDPSRRWIFEDTTLEELARFFAELNLSTQTTDTLFESVEAVPAVSGYAIRPDRNVIAALTPDQRRTLYNRLGRSILNLDQINAFRFCAPSPDEWFGAANLPTPTVERLRRLVYRNGSVLFLADLDLAMAGVEAGQSQRLMRTLSREATFIVTLRVPSPAAVPQLVSYWGGSDRQPAVRPLIESLAEQPGGGTIDVIHLLPPVPRRLLYTYPGVVSDAPIPGHSRDCHWTSLNFFEPYADDRYMDAEQVTRSLEQDYVPVTDDPRFGDLVTFRSRGVIFHSATYIADNIVFGRCGTRPSRPWMFMTVRQSLDFYPHHDEPTISFLRRRAATPPNQ